jgi:hypothetical protein
MRVCIPVQAGIWDVGRVEVADGSGDWQSGRVMGSVF